MSITTALVSVMRLNTRLFLNCLEGVSEQEAIERPRTSTNNLAFIACHLVDSRYFMAAYMGLELSNPFAELLANANGIDDVPVLPPLDRIRQAWSKISRDTEAALGSLSHDDTRAPSPQRFPVEDPTVLGGLGFLIQHESYHIGQMALLRKYVGHPAMSYR